MQHISAHALATSLPARVSYLSTFLELTPSDGEALVAAKPLIAPLIPSILNAVYVKLLSFDITAQAFVPKGTDYQGETVKSVQELTLEHPQIALRKDFLKNYLVKLVSTTDLSPSSPFWVYLNNVGIMHTGQPGFKHRQHRPDLRVEYMHMSALLGYVVDLVVAAVMDMPGIDTPTKTRVIRALNRVVWIQNDLFARHYVKSVSVGAEDEEVTPPESPELTATAGGEEKKGACPFSG